MLSYRHAFHAGGAADVLKHTVLVFCLDYLGQKEKPFLCIDTHAGAGLYVLTGGYAAQNREWESGVGRLRAWGKRLPPAFTRYLDLAEGSPAKNPGVPAGSAGMGQAEKQASAPAYPGSPGFIQKLLRPQDRAACFELHPADFARLCEGFGGDSRFMIRREDGLAALKALLPPPSRRGCIFIDPSYEIKDDYRLVPNVLAEALGRFPRGIYIVWYPLLLNRAGASPVLRESLALPEKLTALYGGNRCRIELRSGFFHSGAFHGGGNRERESAGTLFGSGLVIYNPPWTLKAAMDEALPVLAECLGCTGRISWEA
ncbi:MAG: 23S rRNA (adenine(2030)-N(6))-methyltransferase RlmJ [Treponema sp.]|nr:23S rRNA (adenine(2030)-N(6))-methyltransferase RlmJ [Treponema sp.]